MSKIENRYSSTVNRTSLLASIRNKHVRRVVETMKELGSDTHNLPPRAYRTIVVTAVSVAFLGGVPFGFPGAVTGGLLGAALGLYDQAKK